MPLMCTSNAHPRPGKPETIHHAELYQEDFRSEDRMGASGHRDQGWEEGKHVDNVGEKGIRQPDNRVRRHGVPDVMRTIRPNILPANEVTWTDC